MRNAFSFLALILSLVGIGISLTREEIRCWVGLPSNTCQSSLPAPQLSASPPPRLPVLPSPAAPSPAPVTAAPKAVKEDSKPTAAAIPDDNPSQADGQRDSGVAPVGEKELAPTAAASQESSQPIEVIPPTAESSQPIEVIAPPASSNP